MSDIDTGIAAGVGWPNYLTETWILTSIAIFIMFVRWTVRIRTVGFRGLAGDDYVTIATLCFTIMDAATVTVAFKKGQNVDIIESMIPSLTNADIARLEYGSKVELSAWYSYITLIWCLKFTMLFFYKRITLGSWQGKIVNYLFWLVGLSYIALFCIVTFGCFPYHMNWQVVPITPWKCSFRPQNVVGTCVLNVVTDAALLIIPVPMLWQLKIPIRKKLVIAAILSSGLFVIGAAIVRAVLSLDTVPSPANINSWGVRETFIAVVTVNIPILRPLFNRSFWTLGHYQPAVNRSKAYGNSGPTGYGKSGPNTRMMASAVGDWKDDIEMGNAAGKTSNDSLTSPGNVIVENHIVKASKIVQTSYQIRPEAESDEDEKDLIPAEEKKNTF